MSMTDALDQVWNTILEITAMFVIPDWGALIALLPVFIFLGVVGPLITFTMLGSLIYLIRKPGRPWRSWRGRGSPRSRPMANRRSRPVCRTVDVTHFSIPAPALRSMRR